MALSFTWAIAVVDTAPPSSGSSSSSSAAAGRDLALDAQGELVVLEGDLVLLTGAEAFASDLKSRLQTFAQEYFLDTTIGVPWLASDGQFPPILGGKPRLTRNAEIFRGQILDTPGAVELLAFNVTSEGRELRVSFRVRIDTDQVIAGALLVSAGGN